MKKRILSLLLAAVMLAGALFATGAFAAEEGTGYPDVPATRWSAESIVYMTENGMMNDTGSGKFEPAKAVNRAMVVTVLYRMAGSPEAAGKSTFTDVDAGKWYTEAVLWGAKNEIVTGFSDSTFRPTDSVTREQLVTFIGRYAAMNYVSLNGTDLGSFTDSGKIKDYALDYFKWAVNVGLVNGVTETEIRPTAGATREQFAAIMHRFDTSDALEYELNYSEPTMYSQYVEKDYPLVDDADFYVAVDGDDSNPGTLDKPFATFERAKAAVRELKQTATEEIVVAFKAGDYGYLDNITFDPEDSGTAEVPITYCKYGDGDVIFSNGVTIEEERFEPIDESEYSLFPEKAREHIYKAYIGDKIDKVGQYDTLFSDSIICWEARYPNRDGYIDNYFIDMSTRVDQFKSIMLQMRAKSTADKFSTVDGLKVTGHLRFGWVIDTFLVESYDPETGILEFDFDNPEFESFGDHKMEAWDMENQTGREYDQYKVDTYGEAGWGVLMYEERYDDSIYFHNLAELLDERGEYWVDTDTMTLYVYDLDGGYTFSSGGTFITINAGADYLSFVGLEFNGSSATAIYPYGNNLTFDLCEFRNIASSYVMSNMVNGTYNTTISNCEFEKFSACALDIWYAPVEAENVIYNNYFHNYGWENSQRCAIVAFGWIDLISHNVFEDGGGGAIHFDKVPTIEYNVFDNIMVRQDDQGCVYCFGNQWTPPAQIRYNLFKNIPSGAKYCVYLDNVTCGQEVYGNIFYRCGGPVVVNTGGYNNIISDNILIESHGHFSPHSGPQYYTNIHFIGCITFDYPETGVYERIFEYSKDENRLFVNPTVGDYRIREDADFPDLHFEMMGRE